MISLFVVFSLLKCGTSYVTGKELENEINFDARVGLEVLVVISAAVFVLVLVVLLVILHPPKCLKDGSYLPYHFMSFGSVSDDESSHGGIWSPSDLDSFFIPAEQCRGRDQIRKKIIANNQERRSSRQEAIVNSTCLPDMPEVTVNRYFPGLHEISRISAMNTLMRKPASLRVAKPYRRPTLPGNSATGQPKKLRSILKKTTINSSLPRNSTFVV